MRLRLLLAAALTALATAGPAAAQLPGDLSSDPLDRAVLLALPSVYRLDVVIHVDGLRNDDGRVPLKPASRVILESGTAVAVAPDGWLVSAAHVAAPDPETVARLVHQDDLAQRGLAEHADDQAALDWVRRTHARALGTRIDVTATQAVPAAQEDSALTFTVMQTRRADGPDLALVHLAGAKGAPALELDESHSRGTPVATVGFGTGPALDQPARPPHEPAVRRGVISQTGDLTDARPPRSALAISVPVEHGDSGAPVIDEHARIRGIVTLRTPQGGIAELATEVRQMLDARGLTSQEGPAGQAFRVAMDDFWRLDFAAARESLGTTARDFSAHTLAGVEDARAAALDRGGYRLDGHRRRGLLLGIGLVAAALAAICAAALALPVLLRRGRGTISRG